MTDLAPDLLSEAVVVWTGFKRYSWPHRDDARLTERFGAERGAELAAAVRQLETDFYLSDARHTAKDLPEMSATASADFRTRHPEVLEDAVHALAWCYTYDYK